MSDSTPINIYSAPVRGNDASIVRHRIAIMRAALERGCLQRLDGNGDDWIACDALGWNWDRYDYRIDPAYKPSVLVPVPTASVRDYIVASGHNPRFLTMSQVGDGWRLMDRDEIEDRRKALPYPMASIESWVPGNHIVPAYWISTYEWPAHQSGADVKLTYRTKLSRASLAAMIPRPKVKRPLIASEYPPIFWVRIIKPILIGDISQVPLMANGQIFMSTMVSDTAIHIWPYGKNKAILLKDMMDVAEYSADRVNWLPCYIES